MRTPDDRCYRPECFCEAHRVPMETLHALFHLPEHMTTEQVASYVRLRVGKVDELRRSGVLTGVRTRRTTLFPRRAVFALVQTLAVTAGKSGSCQNLPLLDYREEYEAQSAQQYSAPLGSCTVVDVFCTSDLAARFAATPRQIMGWVADGRLQGTKVGRTWIFTARQVGEFIDELSPATCRTTSLKAPPTALHDAAVEVNAWTLLTPGQVADILQKAPRFVLEASRTGALSGRKIGREWRYTRADVETFIASLTANGSTGRRRAGRRR